MSSSEDSVGDVEVAQGSQVSREGRLAIQVAVVLHGNGQRASREACAHRPGDLQFGPSAQNHLEEKDRPRVRPNRALSFAFLDTPLRYLNCPTPALAMLTLYECYSSQQCKHEHLTQWQPGCNTHGRALRTVNWTRTRAQKCSMYAAILYSSAEFENIQRALRTCNVQALYHSV